jgi:hypothetical protein
MHAWSSRLWRTARFEEGKFKLRPLVPVRNRTVFVVQSLAGSAKVPVA